MKHKINLSLLITLLLTPFFLLVQCNDDNNVIYDPPTIEESTHVNDVYLKETIETPYNTAVRWRWHDRFIGSDQKAVPIIDTLVIPVTKLIKYLWIGPYESVGEQGKNFILDRFPVELQYIGSFIFNIDGTRILGFAEGGARISLLNLNAYNLRNSDWLTSPGGGILSTLHHEFSHLVHQKYGLPSGFNTISSQYLGSGWSNNVSREDAIKLGMVRNYGTANEYEDFCEIISHFLVTPKNDFESTFIEQKDCTTDNDPVDCQELNEGRKLIARKLELIKSFYLKNFEIDLTAVRDTLRARLNHVTDNNKIPE